MMFKECMDACFATVEACERCAFEFCIKSKEQAGNECIKPNVMCAEICTLTARLCARGLATKDLFELCAKNCDELIAKTKYIDHEYIKKSIEMAKDCAAKCRQCATLS